MTEAFVYCWKNTINNKRYIGVHKGSIDDGYICSSNSMLEDYDPSFFVRQILAIGNWNNMYNWETKLLQRINVKNNIHYYNTHNNDGFNPANRKGRSPKSIKNYLGNQNSKGKKKPGVSASNKRRGAWNKGLTKEMDSRVALNTERMAKTRYGRAV